MKLPIYLTAAAAATAVMGIGLTCADRPFSTAAAGFIIWDITPYLGLMLLLQRARRKTSIITIAILTATVAGFGVWMYVDAMLIGSDAQGALVFMVVPFWQWALILIVSLVLFFINLSNNFKWRKQ